MIRLKSADGTAEEASPPLAARALDLLVLCKLLMHASAMTSYGYFRDELYYLASTSHLGWGYVDHPPFSIAVLALVRAVLGDSLPALRIVPAIAGALIMIVAALIARVHAQRDQHQDDRCLTDSVSARSSAEHESRRGACLDRRVVLRTRRRSTQPGRVLAWMYLAVVALLMLAGRSRASYLAPAYPALFALGGMAWERLTEARRAWIRPALAAVVVAVGVLILPFALPVLPVDVFARYQAALGIAPRTEERQEMGVLPQQYADMFGWEEMAALVGEAYDRLTPEERAHCRVFGQNYGEAGAVDLFGRRRGWPPALSGTSMSR